MKHRRTIALLLLVPLVAVISFYQRAEKTKFPPVAVAPLPLPGDRAPSQQQITPARIAMQAPEAGNLAKLPPHPMAAVIGSAAFTPQQEIAAVMEFFQIYRREFGSFPAGEENAQFMNALRGNNPGKHGIFPLTHPRLDAQGNLLDPWGQAYVFHPVSRDRLELRSLGPDRRIFTADDLVMPPK